MTDPHARAADDRSPAERERRRRLAEVFGDAVPHTTRDDRPEAWGDGAGASNDDRLRREVPPHHG